MRWTYSTAPLRIDCGSSAPSIGPQGERWQADTGFENGVATRILQTGATSGQELAAVDQTLRAFPAGNTSCYRVGVPPGRYLVRLSFAYSNYDGRSAPPAFNVTIHGATVEAIDLEVQVDILDGAAYYTDYLAFFSGDQAEVCFVPRTGQPLLNSLQLLPINEDSYNAASLGTDVMLSTYTRINCGGPALGPEPEDREYRTWVADVGPMEGNYTQLRTQQGVVGTDAAPDYLPPLLFETAREAWGASVTGYDWPLMPVDPSNSWLLRLYFAELDPLVRRGERVFNVIIGDKSVPGFDILTGGGGGRHLAAVSLSMELVFPSAAAGTLDNVLLLLERANGSRYAPLISGLELYEIVQARDRSPLVRPTGGPALADGGGRAAGGSSPSGGGAQPSSGREVRKYGIGGLSHVALAAIVAGTLFLVAVPSCIMLGLAVGRRRPRGLLVTSAVGASPEAVERAPYTKSEGGAFPDVELGTFQK